jgi:hypothetical protein
MTQDIIREALNIAGVDASERSDEEAGQLLLNWVANVRTFCAELGALVERQQDELGKQRAEKVAVDN